MNIQYETRYVAFLDLLGFKNMVMKSETDYNMLNTINLALNYINNMQNNNYKGDMPMANLGKQVTAFSDSIVISYNATMPGGGFHVMMDLIYICNDLIGIGIPIRGGITVGPLIHENNKCFGPAMVRAYQMENNEALVPRIIIDREVIFNDLARPGQANTPECEMKYLENLIKVDVDDRIFLDYLSQWNEFNDEETYINYMGNLRRFIVNNLVWCNGNKRLFDKYNWLKNYYNDTVNSIFVPKQIPKFII